MSVQRILYISSEITPFQNKFQVGNYVSNISDYFYQQNKDIRVLVPCFGTINKRKHSLHDVTRLSKNILKVGEEEYPLQIKVASMPNLKYQVYFLDCYELFKKKENLYNQQGKFIDNNDDVMVFFCKGVLETVKQFGWIPDIIHCFDWITSLIPLYIKTTYKKDPIYKNSKVIYGIFNHEFEHTFKSDILSKIENPQLSQKKIEKWNPYEYKNFLKIATHFADEVVLCQQKSKDEETLETVSSMEKEKVNTILKKKDYSQTYMDLYEKLLD